jgi:hypothetical protein
VYISAARTKFGRWKYQSVSSGCDVPTWDRRSRLY